MSDVQKTKRRQTALDEISNGKNKAKGILSLPDDIVFKILKMAAQNVHGLRLRTSMPQRTTLPLVCKKWREILYLQGRSLELIELEFAMEHHSFAAVGQWILQQQSRGILRHPVMLRINGDIKGDSESAEGPEDFCACLGLLGPVLNDLRLVECGDRLFTSRSLRTLWTCPRLRCLMLDEHTFTIDAEDIEVGLQHLRQLEELVVWRDTDVGDPAIRGVDTFPSPVLCNLPNLRTLSIKGQMFTGTPHVLLHLGQLRTLDMDACTWQHGMGPILFGPSLTSLAIRDTDVQDQGRAVSFSASLLWEKMTGLLSLDLSEGRSRALPNGMLFCTQLRQLFLRGFDGLEVQPRLANIRQLTEIRFTACNFQQLPPWVLNLPSLQNIYMEGCEVPWQQSTWSSSAPELRTFSCRFSPMNKVCLSICKQTTLTTLSLQYCCLSAIEPAISNLASLRSLDISHNYFYPEVPYELAKLTTLTMLNMTMNAGSREAAGAVFTNGRLTLPKMQVTPRGLHFLLRFPALAALEMDVTQEEKAALARFLAKLQARRACHCVVTLWPSQDYIAEDCVKQVFMIV